MIQHKTIDGLLLRDMVVAGAALLEKNREAVDALNVFPVPDGDTGTNMSLTMQSATREVNAQEYLRADEAAAAISKGGAPFDFIELLYYNKKGAVYAKTNKMQKSLPFSQCFRISSGR